jgi:hypothetical protein
VPYHDRLKATSLARWYGSRGCCRYCARRIGSWWLCCSCQMRSLHLPPWATPPCWINAADIDAIIARGDDGTRGNYVAAKIVTRLRELGISQFHPDPMTAIESAKKRDAAA